MKKNYIQPAIISELPYSVERPICASLDETQNFSDFGLRNHPYGHNNWVDEGHPTQPVGIEDNNGIISSMTKGRGGDWGSIW